MTIIVHSALKTMVVSKTFHCDEFYALFGITLTCKRVRNIPPYSMLFHGICDCLGFVLQQQNIYNIEMGEGWLKISRSLAKCFNRLKWKVDNAFMTLSVGYA